MKDSCLKQESDLQKERERHEAKVKMVEEQRKTIQSLQMEVREKKIKRVRVEELVKEHSPNDRSQIAESNGNFMDT